MRGPLLCLVPVCLLLTAGTSPAQDDLPELRRQTALRYFEPEPHLQLAKLHHDSGNRILAFYISEHARRRIFEQEEFDAAFARVFRDEAPFDNSESAEAALLAQFASNPDDVALVAKIADIYVSRSDWLRAKEYLYRAVRLAPDDASHHQALAEIFRREQDDAAAENVMREFAAKHPRSREDFELRARPLMQQDPKAARAVLEEALREFPDDPHILFNLGATIQREGDLNSAEAYLVKAALLAKEEAYIQAWTGRFFLRAKNEPARALEYYLSAYFLDPHFYETEYVESRVFRLNRELSQVAFKERREAKTEDFYLEAFGHSNPAITYLALEATVENWRPDLLPFFLNAMLHDDPSVRWLATMAILKNGGSISRAQLESLLQDVDLRRRGLAAYLAVKLWGREGIAAVRPWLTSEVQLLRHDAISALHLEGGEEGRRILAEHASRETHPRLQEILASILRPEGL